MTDLQPAEPLGACDVIDQLVEQLTEARAHVARIEAELEHACRRRAMAQEIRRRADLIDAQGERDGATVH
jgi:hypothetical protein